jgi:hypothetical protein
MMTDLKIEGEEYHSTINALKAGGLIVVDDKGKVFSAVNANKLTR